MKLTKKELVFSNSEKLSIDQALEVLAEKVCKETGSKKTEVLNGLKDREKEISTGLENGISIPHTTVKGLKEPVVVVAKWENPVDWKSSDKKPVDLSIAIFVPESARDEHLKILGKISSLLLDKKTQDAFKKLSLEKIAEKINSLEIETNASKGKNKHYDIVGVTSCPTGIAHTFMAAEALEKAAKEKGLTIKIEKQGQSTVDHLTQDEIDNAKYIVISVGKAIDESRFGGRDVLKTSVQAPIKNNTKVIEDLISNSGTTTIKSTVKTTGGPQKVSLESTMDFSNFGQRSWNGVLAGVSYMLPFVVTGGILIALSFLFDIKNAGTSIYGNGTPLAAWVNSFGGVAFGMMVPVLAGFLAYSIVGRQGLLIGFVIGYLSIGSGPNWIEMFGYNGWMPDGADGVASSGFIGGIAGGIMGAAIVILLDKMFDKILPDALQGAKLILLLPFASLVIGGTLFWFINIPLTFVSWGLMAMLNAISTVPGGMILFGLVAGAMACVDYGGPVNKAAYLFGVFTLTSAPTTGSVFMASVSSACIIPPLGIALATSFKRKTLWDDADIAAGYTNWILGFTHITEGAIPFATKYPKDVYFQTMIAGSITAAVVAGLGIGTMAPHGGVLTFALLKVNWNVSSTMQSLIGISLYIIVLAAGTVLQAAMILFSRMRTVKKEAQR